MVLLFRAGLLALTLTLGCGGATLVRKPYLQSVKPDAASILWTSREKGAGEVRVFAAGEAVAQSWAKTREFPGFVQYLAEVSGLTPGREYEYQVLLDGTILVDHARFRTTGLGPFTFLVVGDSGTGSDAQAALAQRMIEHENPALVLHTGDLSQESGTYDQLDKTYFGVYGPLMNRAPFYPSPGNHDYYTDEGAACHSAHQPPGANVPAVDQGRYYSFQWGNVHFVSLNSNLLEFPDRASRMLEWLDRDLQRQGRFWKIVYFHHTPFPTGHHLEDAVCRLARDQLTPILERHGVHLVLNGHEHSYQRSFPLRAGVPAGIGEGPVYVTTGGGGGILHAINPSPLHETQTSAHHYLRVQVYGARLRVQAIGLAGEVLDQFTLTPAAPVTIEAAVNAGSYTGALAGGSLVAIFGRSMAREEHIPTRFPLPTQLGGTSVTLNGQRLPLLYVSPHQINAQLPYGASGPGTLRVNTPTSTAELPVTMARTAPGVIETSSGSLPIPALTRVLGGSLISPGSPALPGDWVTLYLVGLGAVDGPAIPGEAAPGHPLVRSLERVEVSLGDRVLSPAFAGLAPGFAGLYQVNFQIPEGISGGPLPLRVISAGARSEPVVLYLAPNRYPSPYTTR